MELVMQVGLLFISGSALAATARQSADRYRHKAAIFRSLAIAAAVVAVSSAAGAFLREAAVQEAYFGYDNLVAGLLAIGLLAFLLAQGQGQKAA